MDVDRPARIVRTGGKYLSQRSLMNTRLPMGHPEGFIEGFANIYRNYILALKSILDGKVPKPEHMDFPDVSDGVRGMAFIETAVQSGKAGGVWTLFKS
jgi:hypothetical protein